MDAAPFAAWEGSWINNLDWMALTLGPSGRSVLVTASWAPTSQGAVVSSCAFQATTTGPRDNYVAWLDAAGTVTDGTYFGGSSWDSPYAIAAHPAGGVVIGGSTWSTDMPTTTGCLQPTLLGGTSASDGFLCWLDPSRCNQNMLRYASYFGGTVSEDAVMSLAVETSGIVTAAGYTFGGSFPVTPRNVQPTPTTGNILGMVVRLVLGTGGTRDLHYATTIGDYSHLTSLILDEVGDAWVGGASGPILYPIVNASQPTHAGGNVDGVLTHLPLLPGPVARHGLGCAVPACSQRLYTSMGNAPIPGQGVVFCATNAPPGAPGALLLGLPTACTPVPGVNVNLLVNPLASVGVSSDLLGAASYPLTIPADLPTVANWGLGVQWVFFTNQTCPGTGLLATPELLSF